MKFTPTAIAGAYLVTMQPITDDRGSFARSFCTAEFAAAGIDFTPVQINLSRNPQVHTLRGLHYQADPHGEAKLVQCARGRLFDVAVDLRRDSPSFGAHVALTLDADGDDLFFIPAGCAHGFLTLADNSDVLYHMGTAFVPGVGLGVRWNDPAFDIAWPAEPKLMSPRDAGYADFRR